MLPKHGFWPLNYIPFMLQVGVEPTIKIEQILSLPRMPIPPQEQLEFTGKFGTPGEI